MTSLITLPIRLSLELTARAAKLGVDALRAVTGLLERDEADRAHAAEGGGSGVPWPVAEEQQARPIVPEPPEPPEPVATPIDFDAPSDERSAVAAQHQRDLARQLDGVVGDRHQQPVCDQPADPTVHVGAPWEGYDRMRAADIVARLRSADAATRAVVRLYEQQGKARSSVLAATG